MTNLSAIAQSFVEIPLTTPNSNQRSPPCLWVNNSTTPENPRHHSSVFGHALYSPNSTQ
ncbi:MAG: hypothetical protein V7L05_19095 [Nostoc sp.]|uniref:hypothetical protein n=1 Tax=Nostoc sp. TaxID=1180 RepID=UPI002FFAFAC2